MKQFVLLNFEEATDDYRPLEMDEERVRERYAIFAVYGSIGKHVNGPIVICDVLWCWFEDRGFLGPPNVGVVNCCDGRIRRSPLSSPCHRNRPAEELGGLIVCSNPCPPRHGQFGRYSRKKAEEDVERWVKAGGLVGCNNAPALYAVEERRCKRDSGLKRGLEVGLAKKCAKYLIRHGEPMLFKDCCVPHLPEISGTWSYFQCPFSTNR